MGSIKFACAVLGGRMVHASRVWLTKNFIHLDAIISVWSVAGVFEPQSESSEAGGVRSPTLSLTPNLVAFPDFASNSPYVELTRESAR